MFAIEQRGIEFLFKIQTLEGGDGYLAGIPIRINLPRYDAAQLPTSRDLLALVKERRRKHHRCDLIEFKQYTTSYRPTLGTLL
jgi:hypothetical protein